MGKTKKSTNKKMDLIKYNLSGIGKIEVSKESEAAMDKLEKQFGTQAKELKTLKEEAKEFEGVNLKELKAEAANWQKHVGSAKKSTIEKLIGLQKQAFGEEAVDAEKDAEGLNALSLEALESQVKNFENLVSKGLKQINPTNDPNQKETKRTSPI